MLENCHGALPHITYQARGERDPNIWFTGINKKPSGDFQRPKDGQPDLKPPVHGTTPANLPTVLHPLSIPGGGKSDWQWITDLAEENNPPNEAALRGFMSTADCCCIMWHRFGGRIFTWQDAKDILGSPKQLAAMRIRRYVVAVGEFTPKRWQMTDQARGLADLRAGMWL